MDKKIIDRMLQTDCRTKKGRDALQEYLHKIPPFSKCKGDVSIELLDKMFQKVTDKYSVTMQWIHYTYDEVRGDRYYSASFKNSNKHDYIASAVGTTMYETMAKSAILCYALAKGCYPTKEPIITREELRLRRKSDHDYDGL